MAIQSFSDKDSEAFFIRGSTGKRTGWSNVRIVVRRKLDMLHYAGELIDLRSPPGNRLEALKGNLEGFQSIRINDRWRIVFRWTAAGPEEVAVSDYH